MSRGAHADQSSRFRRCLRLVTMPVGLSAAAVGVSPAHAAPVPLQQGGVIQAPARTQISFQHSPTGFHAGTANEHESRPALSIVKLYIADYVFRHGTADERAAAYDMLRTSNDATATRLYRKYPQSISDTAARYGLTDTHAASHWGYSRTSTADSVRYLEAKKRENPKSPVLTALATASPVAADGYRQDYGTSRLPGVIGTKFGWSDDRRSFHATASYGTDFSVAAQTNGTAVQLTNDVVAAFAPSPVPVAPQPAPAWRDAYEQVWHQVNQAASQADSMLVSAGSSNPSLMTMAQQAKLQLDRVVGLAG